ncbi:MAG: hypothetical protein ACPGYP_04145 [Solirubrobacterales bacterium]
MLVAMLMVLLPSSASAFNVGSFSYTNSNLQASGHPDVAISLSRQGTENEDVKDIRLDLPAGVFANPEAANPKCTSAQFNADQCPSNSQVGDVTATVKALGLLDLTIHGTVNVLVAEAGQTATMGLTLRPDQICILFVFCAVPQKIFLKTGVTIRTYDDSGLRTFTSGSPGSATIGIPLILLTPTLNVDITLNQMNLNFNSRSGPWTTKRVCGGFLNLFCNNVAVPPDGPLFWRQTGSCMPAVSAVTLVSYQGATSSATSTFSPSGCENVPFDPSIEVDPAIKDGGAPTPLDFTINVPEADQAIQHALPKIVDVDLPQGSGLNLEALSGVEGCTEAQLLAAACPASSIIGTADAFSKYLPGTPTSNPGLSGNVYAMGVGNQVPIAVELKGSGDTVVLFRGTMGTRGDPQDGDGRVYSTFDRVPQLPFAQLNLTIAKPVYKNPPTCGTATANAEITGFNGGPPSGNGTVVNRTGSYTVVNCAVEPDTTITAGPPSVSSIRQPVFEFTSTVAGSAFQCKLDTEAFAPCSSPFTSEPLTSGAHTFSVKAINGPSEDQTPATYSFDVSTSGFEVVPQIDVSSTQAVSHRDVGAEFAVSGGQPQAISLRLPDGFAASLSARPLCSLTDADAGTCGSASSIGTVELTVDTFGGPQTGVGEVYLAEGPTPDDAAGVATKVTFTFGDMIVVGGAYLVNNGKNQYLALRDIPQQVGSTQINVTNLRVNMDGSNNFLTTPSDCTVVGAWVSTGIDYDGNESEVFSVPFQATGCGSVPFNPSITQVLSDPVAGSETGVNATVSLGTDNSAIRAMRVSEPPSLAPNFPAFGDSADQCPASAAPGPTSIFDPLVCPAQARVGEMTINTPLLPYALDGEVYLIEKSPIPWLGVRFDRPGISVRLTGVTSTPQVDPSCDPFFDPLGFCQTQISILFNNVPDVQISSIEFVLDGPPRMGVNGPLSGKLLKVASSTDPACQAVSPAQAVFGPFSNTGLVNRSQNISISGCA